VAVLSIGDKRLGAVLLEHGYLTDMDLQNVLSRHQEVGGKLADIIIEMGIASERRIIKAVEDGFQMPLVRLPEVEVEPGALSLVQGEFARDQRVIPLRVEENELVIAMVDPLNTLTVEEIEDATGLSVKPVQALRREMEWAVARHYPDLGLPVPQLADERGSDSRLGAILIADDLITEAELQKALVIQKETGHLLGRILLDAKLISEKDLYWALARQAGLEFEPDVDRAKVPTELADLLLRADAVRLQAVPLRDDDGQVIVAVADARKVRDVEEILGRPMRAVLANPDQLNALLVKTYGADRGRIGESLVKQDRISREQLKDALDVQQKTGRGKALGEILVELGHISKDELDAAVQKQKSGGPRLEDTLVQSGKISPELMARSLAIQLGFEYVDLATFQIDPYVVQLVPEGTLRRYGVMPIRLKDNTLQVAMKDPRNVFAIDDLKLITGREIVPVVALEVEIMKAIDRFFGGTADVDQLSKDIAKEVGTSSAMTGQAIDETGSELDDSAIVRVINSIIKEAARMGASDIHIEPRDMHILVRVRMDGDLREYMTLPRAAGPAMAARVKIMANLNIAERRVPQDGRVRFKDKSTDVDLRLSTLPTVYGEKVVMRILQRAASIPSIDKLGFSERNFTKFEDTILKPYGMFLITGPTGSGKSFTTFSILKRLTTPEVNVTTIEDPVEYEIPGINQTQVNPVAGLDFARALRAFLRQDPDIIMVGEIRDTETAKIAVEAALTGHLLIATLHTNDAAGAITRLDEMGVELFNISASLIGVLAQRLVRRVCGDCAQPHKPEDAVVRRLGLSGKELHGKTIVHGVGCDRCSGSGYRGRMAIHELMVITDDVRKAVVEGKAATEIKDIATAERGGMVTLRSDGVEKAFQGLTTLEEVLAVTAE
jgi:type IV pilus assembly protein PilB